MTPGTGVRHTLEGWVGIIAGPCALHPERLMVQRSPSWHECVSPHRLEALPEPKRRVCRWCGWRLEADQFPWWSSVCRECRRFHRSA